METPWGGGQPPGELWAGSQASQPLQHSSMYYMPPGGAPFVMGGTALPTSAPLPLLGNAALPPPPPLPRGLPVNGLGTYGVSGGMGSAASPAVLMPTLGNPASSMYGGPPMSTMVPTSAISPSLASAYDVAASQLPDPEDKAAVAREKNRLAQRRFREKERKRLEEVQQKADSMAADLAALKMENKRLQLEQLLMEKMLAVRNAMLAVAKVLPDTPPADAADAAGAAAAAAPAAHAAELNQAAVQLDAAIGDLPQDLFTEITNELLGWKQPIPGADGSGGAAGGGGGSPAGTPRAAGGLGGEASEASSKGSVEMGQGRAANSTAASAAAAAGAGAEGPPLMVDVAAAASGLAIPRGRFLAVAPAGDLPAELEHVQHLTGAQLVSIWQGWRERLLSLHREMLDDGGRDPELRRRMGSMVNEMSQVFWHVGKANPRVVVDFLLATLPPAHMDLSERYRRVAADSMGKLGEVQMSNLRTAWAQLIKRSAMAAVAARPWAQKLQRVAAAAAAGSSSLHQLSLAHTQVGEVSARLQAACHDQFLASVAFLADCGRYIDPALRAEWNAACSPHLPDFTRIVGEMLALWQQQRQSAPVKLPSPQ